MASNLVRVKRHVLRLDSVHGIHCIKDEILWTRIWGQLHIFTLWLGISWNFTLAKVEEVSQNAKLLCALLGNMVNNASTCLQRRCCFDLVRFTSCAGVWNPSSGCWPAWWWALYSCGCPSTPSVDPKTTPSLGRTPTSIGAYISQEKWRNFYLFHECVPKTLIEWTQVILHVVCNWYTEHVPSQTQPILVSYEARDTAS